MKKIIGLLDVNNDGEVNVLDMSHIVLRHEWLLVAALFIAIGASGKVLGWWYIDSDLFWAAAGVAACVAAPSFCYRFLRWFHEMQQQKKQLQQQQVCSFHVSFSFLSFNCDLCS